MHASVAVAFELSGRLGVIMGLFIPDEVLTPMTEEPARRRERDGGAPAGDSESSFELLLKAKQE